MYLSMYWQFNDSQYLRLYNIKWINNELERMQKEVAVA